MKVLLYVFIGGGLGSILRYLTSLITYKVWHIGNFPLATFLANMLGCFAIGVLSTYFTKNPSDWKFLFITGICGGYTTFSTFSMEAYQLLLQNNLSTLLFYVGLSLIFGLFMVYLGQSVFK